MNNEEKIQCDFCNHRIKNEDAVFCGVTKINEEAYDIDSDVDWININEEINQVITICKDCAKKYATNKENGNIPVALIQLEP